MDAEKIHDAKAFGHVPIELDPYEKCLGFCFAQISDIVFRRWPNGHGSGIKVTFDLTQNPKWISMIWNQFNLAKKQNPRFASLDFIDDKGPYGNGIQAADLEHFHK